ncbi:MAG: hypothetical protein AAB606_01995 [Patescibacteria group bacterium]
MDSYQKLLCEKSKKKVDLLGKAFFSRMPVVALDISNSKKSKQYLELAEGLGALGVAVLIIAPQEVQIEDGKNIRHMGLDKRPLALTAADIAVVPTSDIKGVWSHGCVPIAQLDGENTLNYNPLQEKGNGFYFKNQTKWEMFAAVVRALETYQFPYDWENLLREILTLAKHR